MATIISTTDTLHPHFTSQANVSGPRSPRKNALAVRNPREMPPLVVDIDGVNIAFAEELHYFDYKRDRV
jgi:hypothetical protein